MNSIKAIIFDLDGVLVNCEPFHVKVEKRLFNRLQLNISDEEHGAYMGKAPDIMWSEIIYNKNLSLSVDGMVKINNEERK